MYESIRDLPETVRDVLPQGAQEVYMEAYNVSWESYDEEVTSELSREAFAARDAWEAVKREYVKDPKTATWYPADEVPEHVEEGDEGPEEEESGLLGQVDDII